MLNVKRIGDWPDIQVTLVAMVLELEFEKEKRRPFNRSEDKESSSDEKG